MAWAEPVMGDKSSLANRLATASSTPLPKMARARKLLIVKDSPDYDHWLWTIYCQRVH